MSLAASDMLMMPGNRASQFGGSQFLGHSPSQPELEMSNLAGMPSDDALLAEIREILRTADLMTVTKKGVKQELERRFGVPLDTRRAYINSGEYFLPSYLRVTGLLTLIIATEAVLSGQL
jgi:chitin synthase